ncbi:MAG: hypothetical protein ACLQNU_06885, partial [Candidatus Dormibacteria bacterium]
SEDPDRDRPTGDHVVENMPGVTEPVALPCNRVGSRLGIRPIAYIQTGRPRPAVPARPTAVSSRLEFDGDAV